MTDFSARENVLRAIVADDSASALDRLNAARDLLAIQDAVRPNSVITVRMPAELHDRLKDEAHEHRRSMNQLCVQKLLLPLPIGDEEGTVQS